MPKIVQSKFIFCLIVFSLCLISLILFNKIARPENIADIPALIKALEKDGDKYFRRHAAFALGNIGPEAKEAVPALINALEKDGDKDVRWRAADALVNIDPEAKEVVPALIKALEKDGDKEVRRNAAYALGKIGPQAKEVVPALIKAMEKDGDEDVRGRAADALGNIGSEAKEAVPALIKAMEMDGDIDVRRNAADAVGKIGSEAKEAVPALIKALEMEKDGYKDNAGKSAVLETYQVKIGILPLDTNPGAQLRPHSHLLELHCGRNIQRLEALSYPVRKTFTWSPGECGDVIICLGIGNMTLKKVYSGPSGFAKFLSAFSTGRRLFRIDDFDEFDSKALKRIGIESITIKYLFSGDRQQIIQYSNIYSRIGSTGTSRDPLPSRCC